MSEPLHERNIPIAKPCIGDEEVAAVREVLLSGWLTQGPRVKAFERAFADRHGVPYALATTSCTTALHLALVTLGIGPGDEVIVPAFTWVATANVVVHCGAVPVFVDVRRDTYNIDPDEIQAALTPRTRAVIVVHLFGLCADMDAVRAVVPDGVAIIEDAACATGAAYRGTPAGGLGLLGCFSFHPRKSVTCGEGGMLTTHDPVLAARADMLRNHGASVPEEDRHRGLRPWDMPSFDECGFNYRMTDLQAAVGHVQLGKLDAFIAARERLAAHYQYSLRGVPWIRPPTVPEGHDHAWQAYVTLVDRTRSPSTRDQILLSLHERGIGARRGTHAITRLRAYHANASVAARPYSVADELDDWTLALPLHNAMNEDDVDYVAGQLRAMNRQ